MNAFKSGSKDEHIYSILQGILNNGHVIYFMGYTFINNICIYIYT